MTDSVSDRVDPWDVCVEYLKLKLEEWSNIYPYCSIVWILMKGRITVWLQIILLIANNTVDPSQ